MYLCRRSLSVTKPCPTISLFCCYCVYCTVCMYVCMYHCSGFIQSGLVCIVAVTVCCIINKVALLEQSVNLVHVCVDKAIRQCYRIALINLESGPPQCAVLFCVLAVTVVYYAIGKACACVVCICVCVPSWHVWCVCVCPYTTIHVLWYCTCAACVVCVCVVWCEHTCAYVHTCACVYCICMYMYICVCSGFVSYFGTDLSHCSCPTTVMPCSMPTEAT